MFFPTLVETGILVKTRKVGKSDYYKFNMENNFVQNLVKLNWMLVKKDVLGKENLVEA